MRTFIYYLFCFLCFYCYNNHSIYAHKANVTHLPTTIVQDTAMITIRQFDKASMNLLRGNPDFQYDDQQPELSWWERFKRWIRHRVAALLAKEGSMSLLNNTLVVLGIFALLYLTIKLSGMSMATIFSRDAKTMGLDEEYTENIHEMDFEQELQKAIQTANYRLAVRLLYLNSLKRLSDCQFINWQSAKTNTAYINELANTTLAADFKRLTQLFEYTWYGDFGVNRQHFQQLREIFQQFDREIK